MVEEKRKRNVNFSKALEELLVESVVKRKEVLENKKTDAVMWKEKEMAWEQLTIEFNSVAISVPRTPKQLQLKYKNLKGNLRKRSQQSHAGMASINDLPVELLEEIFLNLGLKDLMRSSCVSLRWREIINKNIIWIVQCSNARIRHKEFLHTSMTLIPNTVRSYRDPVFNPENTRLTEWCHWRSHFNRYQFVKRNWQKGDFSLKRFKVDVQMYAGGFLINLVSRGIVVHSLHNLDAPLFIMKQYLSMSVDAVEVKGNLFFYSQHNHLICTKWENLAFTKQYEIAVPSYADEHSNYCSPTRPELAFKITDKFLVVQDIMSACFLYFYDYLTGKSLRKLKFHAFTANQCIEHICLEAVDDKVVFMYSIKLYHVRIYNFTTGKVILHVEMLMKPSEQVISKNFFCFKVAPNEQDSCCEIQVWSLHTGESAGMFHTFRRRPVLLTEYDKLIYSDNYTVYVRNLVDSNDLAEIAVGGRIQSMKSVWGNLLVINFGSFLQLLDHSTGKKLHTYLRETIDNIWVDDCRIVAQTSERRWGPTSGVCIIGFW